MSEVKSYRFNDEMLYNYNILHEYFDYLTDKDLLCKILELAVEKVESLEPFDVVVDFKENVHGINSGHVQAFIDEVNEKTDFELAMYLDGHKVGFNYK